MNTGDFARGFERDPSEYANLPAKEWKLARDALIDPAVRWSRFFSRVIEGYFINDLEGRDETVKGVNMYTSTTNSHMLRNIDETAQNIALHCPKLVRQINPLNFHTMNQEMGSYWLRLIDPENYSAPDYIDITVMQARLAVQALRLVEFRSGFQQKSPHIELEDEEDRHLLDKSFVGRITEIDAAVTLLEIVKQQPIDEKENLVVVPGPPKYEGHGDRASDFLLIDPSRRQAHGVQVKTRVWQPGAYDPRYVSMIDGRADLQNNGYSVADDGFLRSESIPGLVSADFMLNSDGLKRHSSFSKIDGLSHLFGPILHAKDIARSLEPHIDFTDRAGRAAANIGSRLLEALYADKLKERSIETSDPDEPTE